MANRAVGAILWIYFWIGALWQGYFAETALLFSNLILFAGWLVVLFLKREIAFSRVHLLIFLIVAMYWISVAYAVDAEQAILEASRVSALLPVSLMFLLLPADEVRNQCGIWPWIGLALTAAGIAYQMFRDGRLESTLAYANALAVFLLVNIFISLVSYIRDRRFVHLVLLTANVAGLWLTFSRSVWVLWLALMLAAVLWMPEFRRRRVWLNVGAAHAAGLIIALLVKGDGFFFWQRVASIRPQTSEFQIRLLYWKDGLGMLPDYWLGGTGGGGWNVLLPYYRTQAYFVKFIHNHYLQLALDIGIFGLLAFAGWLALFYVAAFRQMKRMHDADRIWAKGIVLSVTALALHAGFDFDLTFPMLLGVMAGLTVPAFPAAYRAQLPKLALGLSAAAALSAIFVFGWLASAYGYGQTAQSLSKAGMHDDAQRLFARAERMLPWSSSIPYESAKGYVRQGNETGQWVYYQLAREKLLEAKEKVPEQALYDDLLRQLPADRW